MQLIMAFPRASTPGNKDRFLGTPVKRGANNHCAYGAGLARFGIFRFDRNRALLQGPRCRVHAVPFLKSETWGTRAGERIF